jgi:hypothetical protein
MAFERSMILDGVGEFTHRRGRHLWANLPTKAKALSIRLRAMRNSPSHILGRKTLRP